MQRQRQNKTKSPAHKIAAQVQSRANKNRLYCFNEIKRKKRREKETQFCHAIIHYHYIQSFSEREKIENTSKA